MIWLLLVLFQVKHFLCDFPLQNKYMLGKFKPYPDFILPLLSHVVVHGLGTFFITVFFKEAKIALLVALADAVVHFAVDRVKASPTLLGRFKALSANEFKDLAKQRSELSVLAPDGHYEIRQIDQQIKENQYFWWALGADQFAHHLTHYAIIAFILS